MNRFRVYAALCSIASAVVAPSFAVASAPAKSAAFVAAPWVQLGNAPTIAARESLTVMWLAPDANAAWSVEYRPGASGAWRNGTKPTYARVTATGVAPHRVYRTLLGGLLPGQQVDYRVSTDGSVVFEASAHARKNGSAATRVVIFGDCGDGTPAEARVAYQTYLQKPDYVVIPGDIVYDAGRISEYFRRYFPYYNADEADPAAGAPLIRSTVFMGLVGNHDVGGRNLGRSPDGLAYYLYFDEPLNGAKLEVGDANAPPLDGSDEEKKAFTDAAGRTFPRMSNFSFDYGNVHWTVLDADTYVDWSDAGLRQWLEDDLKRAQKATWRFVTFHQPGFSSSKSHFSEQYMRRLSPVFEKYGVDVVWSGHVHNYQRSLPLKFKPAAGGTKLGPVAGEFAFDRNFDGDKVTKANGVLYIVTGGGGAGLYNPEQQNDRSTWQNFTAVYVADVHSLTVADIEGKRLTVHQIDEYGKECDRWVLTK